MRRRVWCETEALERASDPGVLAALGRRRIELIASVFPATIERVPALLDAGERAGVAVSLWPMLDDSEGRWASATTMVAHEALVRRLLARIDGRPVASLFIDLEPPIAVLRSALHSPRHAWRLLEQGAGEARSRLIALAEAAAGAGTTLSAAAVPLVNQGTRAGAGWQRALGLPLDGVPWEAVHTMMYSSLFEGYSRDHLGREASRSLVALGARQTRQRWGERGAISLGVVGPGALGDERPLAGVEALRQDVATARGEGVEDIALFDLIGALGRPPFEAWLDALVDTPPAAPTGLRVEARALDAVTRVAGVLFSAIAPAGPGQGGDGGRSL